MTRRRSPTETLAENWPIYARLVGLLIGIAEMVAGFLNLPVSTPVLGFAGTLLLAPKIAGVQARRNDLRKAAADLLSPKEPEPPEPPELPSPPPVESNGR